MQVALSEALIIINHNEQLRADICADLNDLSFWKPVVMNPNYTIEAQMGASHSVADRD